MRLGIWNENHRDHHRQWHFHLDTTTGSAYRTLTDGTIKCQPKIDLPIADGLYQTSKTQTTEPAQLPTGAYLTPATPTMTASTIQTFSADPRPTLVSHNPLLNNTTVQPLTFAQ